jgi:cytochrome c oxidase cbb3-type subunit 2
MINHKFIERHGYLLVIGILVVVSIGGIVQLAPLFFLESTIEKVDGVRPYTPLELAGRNIYIREGCYTCHSQQIRPLRDEVERYGHYSLAAESMHDHPFQWGSKRTGPDLARVGGKYSDAWQVQHLIDPRSLVPESVMPPYKKLAENELDLEELEGFLRANRGVGVPYTDEMVAAARTDALAQLDPLGDDYDAFVQRYPRAVVREFDGDARRVTEMDALVAYLQVLGTMVDFSTYKPEENRR